MPQQCELRFGDLPPLKQARKKQAPRKRQCELQGLPECDCGTCKYRPEEFFSCECKTCFFAASCPWPWRRADDWRQKQREYTEVILRETNNSLEK
jgi:hypothetical protein